MVFHPPFTRSRSDRSPVYAYTQRACTPARAFLPRLCLHALHSSESTLSPFCSRARSSLSYSPSPSPFPSPSILLPFPCPPRASCISILITLIIAEHPRSIFLSLRSFLLVHLLPVSLHSLPPPSLLSASFSLSLSLPPSLPLPPSPSSLPLSLRRLPVES